MPQTGQIEAKKSQQRQSQVAEQVNNLERNLPTLHDKIGTLIDRLSPVLKPSVPSETEKGKDSVELVVLAETIEEFGNSVRSAIYKIEDVLERLEL